jgi:hypothetical protein
MHSPAQELAASWQPISFTVAAVQLISRADYHEPFRIRWEVPLGGRQQPTRVDVPYVATAGDTVAPPGGLVSCWASRHALLLTNVVPPRTETGWMLCYLKRGSMLHVVPTQQACCVSSTWRF